MPGPGLPPLCIQNLIFRFLQNKSKIKIWLFNNNDLYIEGQIIVSLGRARIYLSTRLCLFAYMFCSVGEHVCAFTRCHACP